MVDIVLIRHGETFDNARSAMRLSPESQFENRDLTPPEGIEDESLNSRGWMQAEHLARELTSYDFDVVFASPLLRVQQTLQPLLATLNCEVVIDPRLEERRYVGLESILPRQDDAPTDYWTKWSAEVERRKQEWISTGNDVNDFRIGESETDNEFWQRVESVFNQILDNHAKSKVLVAAHGILNQLLLKKWVAYKGHLAQHNCCINSFVLDSFDKPRMGSVVRVNQTSHLPMSLRTSMEHPSFVYQVT